MALYCGRGGENEDECQRVKRLPVFQCCKAFASPCSNGKTRHEKQVNSDGQDRDEPESSPEYPEKEEDKKRQEKDESEIVVTFCEVSSIGESHEQPDDKRAEDGGDERSVA